MKDVGAAVGTLWATVCFVSYIVVVGQGLGAGDLGHRVVGMFLPVVLPQPFLLEGVPGRLSLHQWDPAGG